MADLILKGQVETLYQQAQASGQEFCIDLEMQAPDDRWRLWEWAHLSRADNARRSVVGKKQLIENEHYLLLRSEVQVPHQGGMRSQEVVRIVFSVEGFELWLLMLDTPRGHQIRQFFRECHKRLQLGMSQPTTMNAALEKILERQQNLTEDLSCMLIHGINGVRADIGDVRDELGDVRERVARLEEQQCDQLYVFVRPADQTLMLGYTGDLNTRKKEHEKRGFQFVGAIPGTRKRESEIKKALRAKGLRPKNGHEEFWMNHEVITAFAEQGLPIGGLGTVKPQTAYGRKHRKKADPLMLTPSLF